MTPHCAGCAGVFAALLNTRTGYGSLPRQKDVVFVTRARSSCHSFCYHVSLVCRACEIQCWTVFIGTAEFDVGASTRHGSGCHPMFDKAMFVTGGCASQPYSSSGSAGVHCGRVLCRNRFREGCSADLSVRTGDAGHRRNRLSLNMIVVMLQQS